MGTRKKLTEDTARASRVEDMLADQNEA